MLQYLLFRADIYSHVQETPVIKELGGSSPSSQKPTTEPYPDAVQSGSHPS